MQRLTRKLLLICLMLWLPLQGYAATVMPFCQHGKQDQHASHRMTQDDPQAKQGVATAQDQHHGSSNTPCDNCALCHMCSAPALPSLAAQLPIKPDNFFALPSPAVYSPIFLEQPQRPPLALTV